MSYKLYYFDSRGLAEPIRMILAYGGIEFEDIRAPFVEFPPTIPLEIKEKCTWGQVPLMEFEGKKLSQSLAITRYVAKKVGLVPKDDFEAALCDEYVDSSLESLKAFASWVRETDGPKKMEDLVEIMKTTEEKYFSKFESIIKENGGQRLVGTDLTWADIYLAHIITNVEIIANVDIRKDNPALKALIQSVFSMPKIKDWIEKRPKTRF